MRKAELALVKPVIVFGRYYLHWGKAGMYTADDVTSCLFRIALAFRSHY